MKKITYALKHIFILLFMLAGFQAVGQNIAYYSFIPTATGEIDRDGFDIGYHSIFSQWDLNGDGNITDEEFYNKMFQRLDINADNFISAEEWAPGQKHFFRNTLNIGSNTGDMTQEKNMSAAGFKTFDIDNDAKLSSIEFVNAMKDAGLFDSLDPNRDKLMTRQELNDMIYGLMDLDANGLIEKSEFDKIRYLYID